MGNQKTKQNKNNIMIVTWVKILYPQNCEIRPILGTKEERKEDGMGNLVNAQPSAAETEMCVG